MMNEALVIGIVIAILCGAACMYLYYCISYLEKKMGMMESILVDVRMTLDSLLLSDRPEGEAPPVPISSAMPPPMPAATVFTAPEPVEAGEVEPIPEEKFYSSVLEQAHEAAAEDEGVTAADGSQSLEQVLAAIGGGAEGALGGAAATPAASVSIEEVAVSGSDAASDVNYDAMTRAELLALAEKRGVRVKRSASRNEVIGVLRRTEAHSIATSSAGTENASEPTGSLFPTGDSVDSGFPMDLGQGGESVPAA